MASISKRSTSDRENRYIVHFRDPGGRSREKWFNRKVDAERFARTIEVNKDRGEYIDPRAGRIALKDWIEDWASHRSVRPATQARDTSYIANYIVPELGDVPLVALSPSRLRSWLKDRTAKGYAPSTVRKDAQILSASLEAAVDDGRIAKNPARKLDLPEPGQPNPRFITSDEVWRLADAINPRYRALVITVAFTGLRSGEVRALRPHRLDMLRRSLRVEETLVEVSGAVSFGPPKTKTSKRSVALPQLVVDELARHLTQYPAQRDDLIFTAPRLGPIRKDNFRRRVWLPATSEAGLKGLHVHDLRHTHAAILIEQGHHPKIIQTRLGHSSISVTMDIYGHLFDGLDEAAAGSLDQAYGPQPVGFSWG